LWIRVEEMPPVVALLLFETGECRGEYKFT